MMKLLLRALPLLCASLLLAQSSALDTVREQARAHPEWILPSWLRRERPAWTIVGLAGSGATGLMSHETEVQPGPDAFSCVGWIYLPKEKQFAAPPPGLVLWRLTEGDLPMPYADWRHHDILVHVTFFATAIDGKPVNVARWSLYNEGRQPHDVDFFLAIRPYGVNGKLNPIRRIESRGNVVAINGRDALVCPSAAVAFGALNVTEGEVSAFAQRGETPPLRSIDSSDGLVTAALKFTCTVPPRGAVPFDFALPAPRPTGSSAPLPRIDFDIELTRMLAYWRKQVRAVSLQLPDERFAEAYRASLAYQAILGNSAPPLPHATPARGEAWQQLQTFIDHQCAPGVYAWCDAFSGGTDCAGDFATARANAGFAALLKRALLYEEENRIVIAPGVPPDWLTSSGVRMADAPTRFGKFGYALTHDARKRLLKLELIGEARPPRGFLFQPPLPGTIEKVAFGGRPAPGASANGIEIPADVRKVELTYARRR